MFFSTIVATICFITCHGNSADHFATFTENLSPTIGTIHIYASGPALRKFQDRGIEVTVPFSIDQTAPEEEEIIAASIAKECATASIVITDVGHPFDEKVQKALAIHAPKALRLAYYDNPEPYVPGGYSATAAAVMQAAQGILFANSHLASMPLFRAPDQEIDLTHQRKIGIGYYPICQAELTAQRRAHEKKALREQLFLKNGLIDGGQNILVYFGGNNEEYFSKAFPAFLSLLTEAIKPFDLSRYVMMLQQHPAAKEKNREEGLILSWLQQHGNDAHAPNLIVSDWHSDEAQVVADGALYYQTSMGPQLVLAGIPTIQVGHNTYSDILVKNHLSPSVTNVDQLHEALSELKIQKEPQREVIFEGLGIKTNWLETLEEITASTL